MKKPARRKVVVTGLGVMSACGEGLDPCWQMASQGRTSIRRLSVAGNGSLPVAFGGEITDFSGKKYIRQRKSLKMMSRDIQLAVAAGFLALQDAGFEEGSLPAGEFGVSVGCGIINNDLEELGAGIRSSLEENGDFSMEKFGEEGISSLFPLWFLKYLPNMPACHMTIAFGLCGPSNTLTTSSAASVQAIGEAARIIERGDATCMLAGGTDSKLNGIGLSRYHLLGLLCPEGQASPEDYRPFDSGRHGILPGEGSAFLVLESREHALARGARLYAEVAGYGSCSDFVTDPRTPSDKEGKLRSMEQAIRDAGLRPEEIDWVLANGSGLNAQDRLESAALHELFNSALKKTPVTALKPVTGHLGYASGAVEAALGIRALREDLIPPVRNWDRPGPACELQLVTGEARQEKISNFLLNASGFAGQSSSLVFREASS